MADENRWEYRVITLGSLWSSPAEKEMEVLFNQWGEEGWELVGIDNHYGSNKLTVVAKRPLSRSTRRQRSMPQAPRY